MRAAEPVYVAEGIVGAPPQVELRPPNAPLLEQPDPGRATAGLETSSKDGQTTEPAGPPALPATPRPRLLLALRRAVAQGDDTTIARNRPGGPPLRARLGPPSSS